MPSMPKSFLSQPETLSLPLILIGEENHVIINPVIDALRKIFKGEPSLFPNLDQQALQVALEQEMPVTAVEQEVRNELVSLFSPNKVIYLTGDMAKIQYGIHTINTDASTPEPQKATAVTQLLPDASAEDSPPITKLPTAIVVSTDQLSHKGSGDLAQLHYGLNNPQQITLL